MLNVCRTFDPQGAPVNYSWIRNRTNSSLIWRYKAASMDFGMNLNFQSSWSRSWITLLNNNSVSFQLDFHLNNKRIWHTHQAQSTLFSSFYTLLTGSVLPFVWPNRTPSLSNSALTEEKLSTGFLWMPFNSYCSRTTQANSGGTAKRASGRF